MICYKFDKENVDMSIEAFRNINNRKPYLICNQKTADKLLNAISGGLIQINVDGFLYNFANAHSLEKTIMINNEEFVNKESYKPEPYRYNDCIVYIDDSLEFGDLRLV